jgi:hypothetical protein
MVLPGLQALFGFQLIAVFNQTFWDRLTHTQQILHFVALSIVAIAIALVMTPAAYHRQAERETVSHGFVRLASRLLLWSMFPLLTGISLDFYLIALLIFKNTEVSLALAAVLSLTFFVLWFVLAPHYHFARLLTTITHADWLSERRWTRLLSCNAF